jgi:hypothetical protein
VFAALLSNQELKRVCKNEYRGLKKRGKFPGKVLGGHKQDKKRIVMDWGFGKGFNQVSYTDLVLPEIIHIAMIHDALGWTGGVPVALKFLEMAAGLMPAGGLPIASHIGALDSTLQKQLISSMKNEGIFEKISLALSPLSISYPDWPLAFIQAQPMEREQAIEHVETCVARHFHRHFVPSGIALSDLMWWSINTGKLQFAAHLELPDFNMMLKEPESDIGQKARTDAWLHALGQFSYAGTNIDRTWADRFWIESAKLSECYVLVEDDDADQS